MAEFKEVMKKDLPPTEKQIRTIAFINNRLKLNLPAKTKAQCTADIGKYFEEAKNAPVRYFTDEDWDEMGLDASMFC